jgi:hypothetical protein
MGFKMGRVDHQLARLTSLARQLGENLVEHAKTAPAHEPVVDGLVRAVVTRSITPAQSIPDDKDDSADDQPIIHPGTPCESEKYGSIRRICASESKNKSFMTAPPRAAIESTDQLIRKEI